MAKCSEHIWNETFQEYCFRCEEERLKQIEMTRNRDIGTSIIHDDSNTRRVLRTDSVVDSVIDQFISRAQFGKQKYNTDLDREDLSVLQWLEHAQQEAMDFVLYVEKLKKTLGGKK